MKKRRKGSWNNTCFAISGLCVVDVTVIVAAAMVEAVVGALSEKGGALSWKGAECSTSHKSALYLSVWREELVPL